MLCESHKTQTHMNGRHLLTLGIYNISASFADLDQFLALVGPPFEELSYDKQPVLKKLDELINDAPLPSNVKSQEDVLKILVAQDLAKVKRAVENLIEFPDARETLHQCHNIYLSILHDLGLKFDNLPVYIVNELPAPFDNMPWEALCIDVKDEEDYGVPRGLYFIESRLQPLYSEFTLAHELIHAIIGQVTPDMLARGLEEGVCELLGSLYLGSRVLGPSLTRSLFIYSQLGYQIDRFWELYLEYTRQAAFLYHRFGLDGILTLVSKGRKFIKEIEAKCLVGDYAGITLPAGRWDDGLTDIVNYVTSTYVRSLAVSPLAWYVGTKIKVGDTVSQIVLKSDIEKSLVEQAIEELQERVFCIVVSKEQVVYSDLDFLYGVNALRYKTTTEGG